MIVKLATGPRRILVAVVLGMVEGVWDHVAGFFNCVAVAWLVLQLTGSSLAVGWVLAAASIPMALLMVVGGADADRLSPRTTMLAAGLVRGGVVAVIAILTHTGNVHSPSVWTSARAERPRGIGTQLLTA